MKATSPEPNIRPFVAETLLHRSVLDEQARLGHKPGEALPRVGNLQLSPQHLVDVQVLLQEALHQNPRQARHHNPSPGRGKGLAGEPVEVLEVELGQDRPANTVHGLGPEPSEGNEDHDSELGLVVQDPEERAGHEQG